jgi:hypothetical protein
MPKPKQRHKPPKLPPGGGIHEIVLALPAQMLGEIADENTGQVESAPDNGAVHASDRILLEQLKAALEDRHNRLYSTSEVLRWALWHCPWDA